MQMLAKNLRDELAKLERELARLKAAPPDLGASTVSSTLSPYAAPGVLKNTRTLELEADIAALRERIFRGDGPEEEEGAPEVIVEAEMAAKEQPDMARSDAVPPDPLVPARGRGVRLSEILAFRWPGTSPPTPYVSANLGRLLQIAGTRLAHEPVDKRILRPHHVFDALLHHQIATGMTSWPNRFLPRIAREYSGSTSTQLGQFVFPPEPEIAAVGPNEVIGPELVAVLLHMTVLREKTNNSFLEGGVRHFLAALVLEDIGCVAAVAAGINFVSWRETLARILEEEVKNYKDLGDDLGAWPPLIDNIRKKIEPRHYAEETHAFANDRTDEDLLNTSNDAAALADLLLLDDLKPPVAVGVFGPWGSGKSTLIRLLRDQIALRTSPRENEPAQAKVVQINFDAWSHADAENLWASLTAELFDQLADAIDGREADGKLRNGLITEIAKRLRKDTDASPLAEGAIRRQREAVEVAEAKLANLEHEPVAATVADEMAKELIAKATPKLLSDKDKKNPEKKREADKAEENKKHLDELLQACGVPPSERDPEKLASILSGLFDLPGRATLLFVLLRRSAHRGIFYGLGAALMILLIGAGGAVWQLGWGEFKVIWTYVVSGLPSLALLGTIIGTAGVAIRSAAPILRLAADFLVRKEKRAAELNKERREAAEAVKSEREKLDTLLADQKKATEFAETYSVAAEGRSREGLLRYFITFSPELAEVRKKLGLLATVRRCFETLEQIMHEKRGVTPPTASEAGNLEHVPDVKRIIVYIDDLDRCSEQHVVQVLQAIHLLLAFDLFVVVVAVDARWLHRAVGKVYSGQLAAPGQSGDSGRIPPAAGATVADYLEKIFQLPIWMQPMADPAMVERFVRGIDKPEDGSTRIVEPIRPADVGDHRSAGDFTPVDAIPDPALLQAEAQRRATMSEPERRALAAMGPLAGKSPRGLKRLVNTYRLMRVMRGPAGIEDLERGIHGLRPLYPYLLFALACEVGLPTETAALLAEVACRPAPPNGFHPLVACLRADEDLADEDKNLDNDQKRLRKCLDADDMRSATLAAVRAVYEATAGNDPLLTYGTSTRRGSPGHKIFAAAGSERFAQAFADAARFTFRPRSR